MQQTNVSTSMEEVHSSFFGSRALFVLDNNTLAILDANEAAEDFYGFSRAELCQMNIHDLGEKKDYATLAGQGNGAGKNGKIWIHQAKWGEKRYVQFTSHMFNYKGKPAKLAVAHDVSDQIESRETRIKKFPRIQLFKGNRPLAEIVWDAQNRVRKWSDKAEELFGWSQNEVLGKLDFFERFIHKKELDQAHQVIADNVKARKRSYSVHGRVRTKKGEVRVCEWHNTLVYDEEGELLNVYSLVQDVSDRKESEYLFKALSEESLVGVYLIQDGMFRYVNPRFADIFKHSKEDVEDVLGPLDLAHPDDRDLVKQNINKRLSGETNSIQYDFRCLTKDRETIHVQVFGTRIEYLGKPAIVGTLLDITNSKLAFKRYQASLESFEDLFDSISDAIYIQDKNQKFIKVNDAAVKLNGYERDFLIGNTPDVLAAPGKVDLQKTHEYFEKALNGTPQKFEHWGRRKNGEIFPEEVVLNPGTYFGENVVIAIARDVSERYQIEGKIEETEERLSQLFQNAPFGIAMMDKHQDISRINPAFEQLFGYSEKEVEGANIDKLIVPEPDYERAKSISDQIIDGDVLSSSGQRKKEDGSLVEVLVYGVPVLVNKRTNAIFGIYMDISDRKKAEEKIKKSLKEKEVLLAEIHHRVKNNLAVITGLLELQQYKTDSKEAGNILRQSQLRINSIALIHEKLYQNENLSEISIDVYIEELIDIIISSMTTSEKDISVSLDTAPISLTINQAIPCGLIINELITNAFKHAFTEKNKGKIKIELNSEENTVFLSVKDDGKGIPDDLNFENPETLGLTLIQTLSKQLEGSCSFENLEEGLCFTLTFTLDK